jgi:hypothetical protein
LKSQDTGKKPKDSRQRGGAQEFVSASIFPNKDYRLKSTVQVWYVSPSTEASMLQLESIDPMCLWPLNLGSWGIDTFERHEPFCPMDKDGN